ncbi:MAG TPA: 4a-hydroxytetrahydrobiopterin dehydratase [Luteimonas sp.]|nr:4a-hydroxytetrahydrobiopterin dehydratase [Luteimonas sp.]
MTHVRDLPHPHADAHCTPLQGASHRLDPGAIQSRLRHVPGWTISEAGDALERTFHFEDYYRTLSFVNALAYMAHRENHHPDLGVHYDRCVVRYSTHDVGGLSENDFICAGRASLLAG